MSRRTVHTFTRILTSLLRPPQHNFNSHYCASQLSKLTSLKWQKGNEFCSLPRVSDLCSCMVSILLIYFECIKYLSGTISFFSTENVAIPKNGCHISPLPPYNDHLHTTATFLLLFLKIKIICRSSYIDHLSIPSLYNHN